jgi:hypothetical protein
VAKRVRMLVCLSAVESMDIFEISLGVTIRTILGWGFHLLLELNLLMDTILGFRFSLRTL